MATNNAIDSQDPIQTTLGGTGRPSLTNHGVLIGAGTSAITQLAVGSNGNVLIASTAADPAFAALTSSLSSIAYTNGAGTLNIDVTSYADKVSWTPTLTFGGASVGMTFTTQTAIYSRFDKLVFIAGTFVLSNVGSSTGSAQIESLPFAADATAATTYIVNIFIQNNNTVTNAAIFSRVIAAGSVLELRRQQPGNGSNIAFISNTSFTNTTQLNFSGVYLAA